MSTVRLIEKNSQARLSGMRPSQPSLREYLDVSSCYTAWHDAV